MPSVHCLSPCSDVPKSPGSPCSEQGTAKGQGVLGTSVSPPAPQEPILTNFCSPSPGLGWQWSSLCWGKSWSRVHQCGNWAEVCSPSTFIGTGDTPVTSHGLSTGSWWHCYWQGEYPEFFCWAQTLPSHGQYPPGHPSAPQCVPVHPRASQGCPFPRVPIVFPPIPVHLSHPQRAPCPVPFLSSFPPVLSLSHWP